MVQQMPMNAPQRFKVIVGTIHQKKVTYSICTWLGERKAIAIAAQAHLHRMPEDRLYTVDVELLKGNEADPSDIIDRTEW